MQKFVSTPLTLANSFKTSTLTVHCPRENVEGWPPPLNAEAKEVKSLSLHTRGYLSAEGNTPNRPITLSTQVLDWPGCSKIASALKKFSQRTGLSTSSVKNKVYYLTLPCSMLVSDF